MWAEFNTVDKTMQAYSWMNWELPEKCRQAFSLYMFNERGIPEIAAQLKVSERMIRQYISEALAWCRVKRERSHRR